MLLTLICVLSISCAEDRVIYIPSPRDVGVGSFSIVIEDGWMIQDELPERVRGLRATHNHGFVTKELPGAEPPLIPSPEPNYWKYGGWIEVFFIKNDSSGIQQFEDMRRRLFETRPEFTKPIVLPNGFEGYMHYLGTPGRKLVWAEIRKGYDIAHFSATFREPLMLDEYVALERMIRSFSPEELP